MSSLGFQWVPGAEIFCIPISGLTVSEIEHVYVISGICELNSQQPRSPAPSPQQDCQAGSLLCRGRMMTVDSPAHSVLARQD